MSNIRRILLTGGRAPATLELVRLLGPVCEVHVADSTERYLCRHSKWIKAAYTTPSPRFNTEAFIQSLIEIIRKNKIDCLIPTCEEIFFISSHLDRLLAVCDVFAMNSDTLLALHNKFIFAQSAKPEGVSSPETGIVNTRAQILHFM